jgi:hypothetical protein
MDKEKAASLGSLLLSVRGDSLRQFIYPDINNNVPPEWQRKVKKDDDDQSLIPVAVFSSKTDSSGPIVKPVDFPNVK